MFRAYRKILSPSAAVLFAMALPSLCVAQTLYGSAGAQDQRENAVNMEWAYNWGIEPKHNTNKSNFEFVPMIWSGTPSGVQGQINRIFDLEDDYGVHVDYVLGFNEPELPTQANMSVQTALDTWDVMTNAFESTDIKLVSPAVSGSGAINNWLDPFMDEVENRNADADPNNDLQVDAIAYHFYTVNYNPQTEATKLLQHIDQLWADYDRPIWLTEFAGTSFSLDNPVHSVEERTAFNAEFLEILIPEFDARPYVERVAWWQFGALGQPYSALSTSSGGVRTPTELGEIYSRTTLEFGDSYDFAYGESNPTDVHYLKGGTLTNTGPALGTALRAIDALEGISSIAGNADYGFEDAEDAFFRIRDGATLRKEGSNTIRLPGATIYTEGTLLVESGTMQLEDGAQLTGEGEIRVDQNGTFATSGGAGGDAITLDSRMIVLNSGMLQVKDGLAKLNQQLRFWNPSEVRTDGDLVLSGYTDGAGRILSTGSGTLFLNGEGLHQNGATVSEGSLIVANRTASATGAGDVRVTGAGTLGGYGQVGGNVVVEGGATVAPGVFRSSFGTTSPPTIDEGTIVDALDFDFTGVQDDAPLTQTSTLSEGLRLVSGLDFGPGVEPRGAANNGNEFNVMGFGAADNYGAAGNAGDYLTFTISPVEGLAMVIEDVTFELRRNGGGAAEEYVIATSLGGFAWADRWGWLDLENNDTSTHVFTASNPGSEAVTEEVEIRITGMDANSAFGNTHFYAASVDASFVSDPNHVAFQPAGILELGGNFTQLEFATLEIELGGTSNADPENAQFDQLHVTGDALLDGTLDVSFLDGFVGSTGQTFDIITANSISGSFDEILAPEGMGVSVTYLNSVVRVELIANSSLFGDADNDFAVAGSDLLAVTNNFGSTGPADGLLLGDADDDGAVAGSDLLAVTNNFGSTLPGEGNLASTPIPEPSSVALAMLCVVLIARKRKIGIES